MRVGSVGGRGMTFNLRIAAAIAALPLIVGGVETAGLRSGAAAVVGQPISTVVPKGPPATIDQLRRDYKRPATIPFPADNPYTMAKVALGKALYFDTRLSGAYAQSCASCHNPGYGWGDGQPKGVGAGMKTLGRRSPTIINAAFGPIFMWDGRAASLEEQALGPIKTDVEMNMPLDHLMERLKVIAGYGPMFAAAFPNEVIKPEHVARAIATFERTVVSPQAPFDAWIEGDEKAISEQAKRGFALFNTKAGCNRCHSGWNFTDGSFHDIGLTSEDVGRGKFLPSIIKMQHAFKTPGLREIGRRGPYMHDGSLPSLEAVVDHYDTGGIDRPSRSDLIKPLALTASEKTDLVAFMWTLTGEVDPMTIPALPR
ncbi:MAG TPA: cytochrome c peroxidase [Xanthobacteraceae bacterium]|nr:cytochrome c peroxidase [Xanthobacteraceae bacterium]